MPKRSTTVVPLSSSKSPSQKICQTETCSPSLGLFLKLPKKKKKSKNNHEFLENSYPIKKKKKKKERKKKTQMY